MTGKAAKLKAAADAAAQVRAYQTDPDVVALRVERVRGWVDRLIWTGMVLGLLFTMANVARFAADGAPLGSLVWVTAWLLDPMVSLVLIGVLMGEQLINRHGLDAGRWVRTTKWVALGCTYAMNTWSAWAALDPAAILLHSVPPAMVFCAAEAVVTIRQRITEAVTVAHRQAAERAAALRAMAPEPVARSLAVVPSARTGGDGAEGTANGVPHSGVRGPHRSVASVRTVRGADAGSSGPRLVRGMRGAAPGAGEPVDRDAVVAELTSEILAAVEAGGKWSPDYPALMAQTGRKRRWCEGVVSQARNTALRTGPGADEMPARAEGFGLARTDRPVRTEAESADEDAASQSAGRAERVDAEPALAGAGGGER
ncbi:hypothetical protein [Actinomadura litoris]|uniref:DUF2637 domain-containing protein n=1 Tax=Actinomadura litoris TaxID=2678616 RepID=A0A7K1L2V4_9ACTN|nr:hypothetical protein [Actinomadura litoris]MUN38729.1 hypothetical protein [Actinomadura litoris]